jgi:hypothetical protein
MTGKSKEVEPKSVKLTFTCAICGVTEKELPSNSESQLARMQRHAMEKHGVTRSQIICAHREAPCALTYQWRLQDGRVYLISTRFVEEKTIQKCVHYWIIGNDNVGVCKFCKKRRDFGRLQENDIKITIQRTGSQSQRSSSKMRKDLIAKTSKIANKSQ